MTSEIRDHITLVRELEDAIARVANDELARNSIPFTLASALADDIVRGVDTAEEIKRRLKFVRDVIENSVWYDFEHRGSAH